MDALAALVVALAVLAVNVARAWAWRRWRREVLEELRRRNEPL